MTAFEYNRYGYMEGHRFTFGWASDVGAQLNFDEFGWVTFNASGYGENTKVKIQLAKEYNRFFCSTTICHGFSNWVSTEVQYFTILPWFGNVSVLVRDRISLTGVAGAVVQTGLPSRITDSLGKASFGQYTNGTYPLIVRAQAYEDYTGTVVVKGDLSFVVDMNPTGLITPGTICSQMPSYLQGICTWTVDFGNSLILNLKNVMLLPMQAALVSLQTTMSFWDATMASMTQEVRANADAAATGIATVYSDLWNTYSLVTTEWQRALARSSDDTAAKLQALENRISTAIPNAVESGFMMMLERILEQEVKR